MKLAYTEVCNFTTVNEQILVKVTRKKEELEDSGFVMTNSSDKSVTTGEIVSAPADMKSIVGHDVVFPVDGTIVLDSFIDFDDADQYEYRLVKLKNVFLLKQSYNKEDK